MPDPIPHTSESARPGISVFHLTRTTPVLWPRNNIGATDRSWWFYDVRNVSRWFTSLGVSCLQPGESEAFHSHLEEVEGPHENWYFVFEGQGQVRTEYGDYRLGKFDAVFVPTGAVHQMRNAGTARLWYGAGSSSGGHSRRAYAYGVPCSEARPGYQEEYDRIVRARESRGLPGRGGGEVIRVECTGDRPQVKVFHLVDIVPRFWPRNELGASDKYWWFYTATAVSRWFHSFCIACVQPGGASTFHSHMEEFEGPYETWYVVLEGQAEIRSEYADYPLERFDAAFMPAGASHQMRNVGTELLWYGTISSRGDSPLVVDTYEIPSGTARPGYLEEYNRIMEARRRRGLSVP